MAAQINNEFYEFHEKVILMENKKIGVISPICPISV